MMQAEFNQEVNARKAEAELAYTLQAAKEKQTIREQQIEIEVIERRKLIEVEDREIERREKELQSTVRSPAEAESYKMQTLAEAAKTKKVYAAQADAQRIKMAGAAEADAIEAIGKAEAEMMRQKASAYKQYGDAAVMALVLEAMPKIASEISAPLGKTEEIIIINEDQSGNLGRDITKLMEELPQSVQALTGVDLTSVLGQISVPDYA